MDKKIIQCSFHQSGLQPWLGMARQHKYPVPRLGDFISLSLKHELGQPYFCSLGNFSEEGVQ